MLLVHGLLNADWWLWPLAARLRGQGFNCELFGYASVLRGPDAAVPRLLRRLAQGGVTAVVGHSLGGLLTLEALRTSPAPGVERVVCLGSPLRGSAAVRELARHAWGRPLLGRSAELLQAGVPDWRGAAAVGMVAGDLARGLGQLFAGFNEPSDGTVAVAETRLPGLADHCIVRSSHSGLVLSTDAMRQASHFLSHGRFDHGS